MHLTDGGIQGFAKNSLCFRLSTVKKTIIRKTRFLFPKIAIKILLSAKIRRTPYKYWPYVFKINLCIFALVDNQGSLQTLLLFTSEEFYIVALPKMQHPCLSHPKILISVDNTSQYVIKVYLWLSVTFA